MTLNFWVGTGLAIWGLMLLILILGMLKAASREDDAMDELHSRYEKDTHV